MKTKQLAAAISLACAGLALSPTTWADFPGAGVDNVPSLAQFKVTFTKRFAKHLRSKGLPYCIGYEKISKCPADARTYTSPTLYEPNTKIGRSSPHLDGGPIDKTGAKICETGSSNSCTTFLPDKVREALFQWEDTKYENDGKPFDEGPNTKGEDNPMEVHTQVLSFQLNPLHAQDRGSATRVRAGDKAPCQARSIGEVESLNGGKGFPAESTFHMYVEVDVDYDKDGKVDLRVYNEAGIGNTVLGGDPLVIESPRLDNFPPKVIYSHTGDSTNSAPKIYLRSSPTNKENCDVSSAFENKDGDPVHIGWIRVATHGVNAKIEYGELPNKAKRGQRDSKGFSECPPDMDDLTCFTDHFNKSPMMFVPPEEDGPYPECPPDCKLIELESFMVVGNAGNVVIGWTTASEIENAGFHLWRAKKANEGEQVEFTLPDGTTLTEVKRITETLIPARGASHNGIDYSYVDSTVEVGNAYYYAIQDIDYSGDGNIHLELIKSATVK